MEFSLQLFLIGFKLVALFAKVLLKVTQAFVTFVFNNVDMTVLFALPLLCNMQRVTANVCNCYNTTMPMLQLGQDQDFFPQLRQQTPQCIEQARKNADMKILDSFYPKHVICHRKEMEDEQK